MRTHIIWTAAIAFAAALTGSLRAQDLYDTSVLRAIHLTFEDADWEQQLRDNYPFQTNMLADLEMEGQVYEDVGVRIRGNTSYTQLPPGSQKFSLNIEMDFNVDGQNLLGYSSLNLNNAFIDPTFCREVAYNNFVARFIPNSRANHVTLTINGENWGVYVNVQQFNRDLLRAYFDDEDGLRIRCANNPVGPGLRYTGPSPAGYTTYDIMDDGGLADPWAPLIAVCDAVTNSASAEVIDEIFVIDRALWSIALENLLTDTDGYVSKGCDFVLYRDPVDGRMHLLQRDSNETFQEPEWLPTRAFGFILRPLLTNMMTIPGIRQRYFAHYRTAIASLDASELGAEILAIRDLIDQAVQDDPKKLYTYQQFRDNFTETVDLSGTGGGAGELIGLLEFLDQRIAFLASDVEVSAVAPIVTDVAASATRPDPGDPVYVTATVAAGPTPIAGVDLHFSAAAGPFERTSMRDDGLSGDGVAGDGVYGILVPITPAPGQVVRYYVGAVADDAFDSTTFAPALTENAPMEYRYAFGTGGMRITEWMYSGDSGEFVEFTNLGDEAIDMTGWSMDDGSATPGTIDLSGAGVVEPGASVILTEATSRAFESAWGLAGVTVIGDNADARLGRNDVVHLFDGSGALVDRLRYGDEDFPGSIRARDASGQAGFDVIGDDDVVPWVLAEPGDAFGSWKSVNGEFGTPGVYVVPSSCPADVDGGGTVDLIDLLNVLADWGEGDVPADINQDGVVDLGDVLAVLAAWGRCP